jgi:hypothetical protein
VFAVDDCSGTVEIILLAGFLIRRLGSSGVYLGRPGAEIAMAMAMAAAAVWLWNGALGSWC